jgi:hypothetical protein
MIRRYWNIDDGLQLLVESNLGGKTAYHMLNSKGKWQDGIEDAIDYVFKGERGAVEIQEPEARRLAAALGSSLDDVPPMPD